MTKDELKVEIAGMSRETLEALTFLACSIADTASLERDRLRFELLRAQERVDVMLERCPLESLQ